MNAKKLTLLVFAALAMVFVMVPMTASSAYADDTAAVGNIQYSFDNGTAVVTGLSEGNVQTLEIPSTVTYNGKTYDVVRIERSAFADCMLLKSVRISSGVKEIDKYAFWCSGLESVELPESLMSIGESAFGNTKLSEITIPSQVTEIGEWAFNGCKRLETINLPDNLTEIGTLAFEGTAYYKNSENWEDGVLYIGPYLIRGQYDGTNIVSGVYEVKAGTKVIAESAFDACTSLTGIIIPESVTDINAYSFLFCTALTSIELPEGLSAISKETFSKCIKLTDITIPSTIMEIGKDAFYECSALTQIHFGGSKAQWNNVTGEGKPTAIPVAYGKYDITFDANNGSSEKAYQAAKGSVTLNQNAFSHDGYMFAGWNTQADGNGSAYADNAEINVTDDLTLYAQWIPSIDSATVTLDETAFVYDSKNQRPVVSKVEWKGSVLTEGEDYKVTWADESVDAGNYTVTISGMGNYAGKTEAGYKITAKSITPTVILSPTSYVYTGKVRTPKVIVKDEQLTLTEGKDYTVTSASNRKNTGSHTLTVKLKGNYSGTGHGTFKITKAKNTLTVKAKTASLKYSKVKKKGQTLVATKVIDFTKRGQGTLAYTKISGNKKITINKKTGKVAIKKGLKKGTYKIKVKVKAAGNTNYKASAWKVLTFKVKIK